MLLNRNAQAGRLEARILEACYSQSRIWISGQDGKIPSFDRPDLDKKGHERIHLMAFFRAFISLFSPNQTLAQALPPWLALTAIQSPHSRLRPTRA